MVGLLFDASSEENEIIPEDKPSFSVRRAKRSDMAAVREMIETLFPSGRSRQLPGDKYLVAERKGLPIGFCHYRMRGKICYIAGLGVLAHYREHGVGSHLMAEVLYDADRKGIQTTYLKVRALNSATKLYLQFGFFERRMGETLLLVRKRQN
ncbi:Acetyltransferase (GNAT) domain protein [uncultured archaeon]|nr:Acetyltransferase (GNAT) domain protein [uncultured archaeon]